VTICFFHITSMRPRSSIKLDTLPLASSALGNDRRRSCRSRLAGCLVLFLLLSAGCAQRPRTIAFIPQETADDLWEPAHLGATNAARGSGFRVYWNGPTRPDDVQRQILLLDRAIQRGDQGIMIAPGQSLALMTPVLRAISEGLPTVVLGSPLPVPAAGGLSYVLNDEDEEGRIAATRLCERLHGRGSIAVLGVNPGTPGLVLRLHAFQMAIHRQCDVAIVAVRMGSEDEGQAEHAAQEVLVSQPHLNAIFALSKVATLGAFRALRDGHKSQQVVLVGCDQQYELLYYLSQGTIDSIIAQNTYEMAGLAIRTIIAQRNGQKDMAHLTLVKPVLLTRDNLYEPQFAPILAYWRSVP
jgi:ribose transport system substrate-binding protein